MSDINVVAEKPDGADAIPVQSPPPVDATGLETLIILPVRGIVLFPGMVAPLTVGRKGSVAAAQQAMRENRPIGIVMQRDEQDTDPGAADLHAVGTMANLLRYVTTSDGAHHLVAQGIQRFRVIDVLQEAPYVLARVRLIEVVDQL